MTKVTILGKSQGEEPKKKIEFIKYLSFGGDVCSASLDPSCFKNIELICAGYGGYDLMFAYHYDRNSGYLYLGHFNDGVV